MKDKHPGSHRSRHVQTMMERMITDCADL